jgi:hypothetical protein
MKHKLNAVLVCMFYYNIFLLTVQYYFFTSNYIALSGLVTITFVQLFYLLKYKFILINNIEFDLFYLYIVVYFEKYFSSLK